MDSVGLGNGYDPLSDIYHYMDKAGYVTATFWNTTILQTMPRLWNHLPVDVYIVTL